MPRPTRVPGPRLWNAKKRIQTSIGLKPLQHKPIATDPVDESWRKEVSQDIIDFVDKYEGKDITGQPQRPMLPQDKRELLKDPVKFFSRPHNVPSELRKQVLFPDFTLVLLRTPHLGPKYAQFEVPLWFSKLDLKSYLKNIYNVDTNHVRSYVIYQRDQRERPVNPYQLGRAKTTAYKKRMTAELVEAFVWPEEVVDKEVLNKTYENDAYWRSTMALIDAQKKDQKPFPDEADVKYRRSLADQAKALLEGREKWKPTWYDNPADIRVMMGPGKSPKQLENPPQSSRSPPLLR